METRKKGETPGEFGRRLVGDKAFDGAVEIARKHVAMVYRDGWHDGIRAALGIVKDLHSQKLRKKEHLVMALELLLEMGEPPNGH